MERGRDGEYDDDQAFGQTASGDVPFIACAAAASTHAGGESMAEEGSRADASVKCQFVLEGRLCKPCRWFQAGTCKAGSACKFCHVHAWSEDASEKKMQKMDRKARKNQQALDEMLPVAEMRSLAEYSAIIDATYGPTPGGAVLGNMLRQAYVASMAEKRGRIDQAKALIEKSDGFFHCSTDGFFQSRRQASLWQDPPPAAKALHEALQERLRQAESLDVIHGWFAVIEEVTRLMSLLTEATRGASPDEDLDELAELLTECHGVLAASRTHAECRSILREMFGSC